MKSPVTDEMDAKIERESELKAAREFALEEWAELQGIELCKCDVLAGHHDQTHYHQHKYDPFTLYSPTIDHPFMHSLIKELDKENQQKFLKNLLPLIDGIGYVPLKAMMENHKAVNDSDVRAMAYMIIDALTASVDNLLLAFHKVFK